MSVFKEIKKADKSGVTQFFRLSAEKATVETNTAPDFYTFKGNVSTRTKLPTSNISVGDAYYIEDEDKVVFWIGGEWANVDTYVINYNYENASNKPSINGHILKGQMTAEDLDLQPAGDYLTEVPSEYITDEELAAEDYASKTYVMEQINNAEHFHREVVDALPLTGKDNVLYLVPKKGSNKDVYNEYIWTGTDYELLGTTAADLTDYYNKTQTDELLNKKVNTKEGFGLSSNDYTTAEKTKLASLENYDDTQIKADLAALHNYDDTSIKNDITALKTAENALKTDVESLQENIKEKTGYIRLVKAGDSWSWIDINGNTLSYTQAREALGQEENSLIIEGLENDGKTSVERYNIDGDIIHIWCVDNEKNNLYLQVKSDDVVITNEGLIFHYLGQKSSLPTNANKGDVVGLEDHTTYYYNGSTWIAFGETEPVDLSNYLAKNNTIAFMPTGDYNPVVKKYVDDKVPTKISQLANDKEYITKTANNLTNYYSKTNVYTKTETDALIKAGGGSTPVVDSLTSSSTTSALSANQGRVLKDYIDNGVIDGGTF